MLNTNKQIKNSPQELRWCLKMKSTAAAVEVPLPPLEHAAVISRVSLSKSSGTSMPDSYSWDIASTMSCHCSWAHNGFLLSIRWGLWTWAMTLQSSPVPLFYFSKEILHSSPDCGSSHHGLDYVTFHPPSLYWLLVPLACNVLPAPPPTAIFPALGQSNCTFPISLLYFQSLDVRNCAINSRWLDNWTYLQYKTKIHIFKKGLGLHLVSEFT